MKVFAVVMLVFVFTACQTVPEQPTARDVKRNPNQGGIIALKTEHREEDRAKADMMMQKTCGNMPVKIKEEGEVLVGQAGSSQTEWQITYDCGSKKTKR